MAYRFPIAIKMEFARYNNIFITIANINCAHRIAKVIAVRACKTGHRYRNIRQNLFWAFFYNSLGIPVAAGLLFLPFGLQLSPMLGAAAMSFSSVVPPGRVMSILW